MRKISNKSVSTAARQTRRVLRRINQGLRKLAISRGHFDLLPQSNEVDRRVDRMCRRQRRKFASLVAA